MKSKINRNDPCHCGSGKKYKNCHEKRESKNTSKFPLIFGAILIIGLGFFLIKPNQNLKSGTGKPGQVWSEEHGHWHDAPTTTKRAPIPAAPIQTTQPKEEAPAGKVWSEEHGHWHDDPSTQATSATPVEKKSIKPPGPAPEGKVWSEEHGHWHDAPAKEQSQTQ